MEAKVIAADDTHFESLLKLFNDYRTFYEQSLDESGARSYLESRIQNNDAVIFVAVDSELPNNPVGFVLLYPTFESVDMQAIWVLHDLFVNPVARRQGIGRMLMNTARDYCHAQGAGRVDLATSIHNTNAQALYESLGYKRDTEYYRYSLEL
jgi:ribosomal protein S18 acetylase RimI-like enzyme